MPNPSIPRHAAEALATYIHHTIRPDWGTLGITTAIGQAATTHTNPHTIATAALNAANTLTNRTPAVIPLPGPHWPTGPNPGVAQAGVQGPACEDHPEELARHCRGCLADVKVGDRPRDMVGLRLPPVASSGA